MNLVAECSKSVERVTESKVSRLRDRAARLTACRAFFSERGVIEVDCPALSSYAPIDLHIDLLRVEGGDGVERFLHSSPEYGMKRLLAEGMGDIYQISHVFRDGEVSPCHSIEFTMVEWYRLGLTLGEMIDETVCFASLFLGKAKIERMSYREAFLHFAGVDPFLVSCEGLSDALETHGITHHRQQGRDDLLNLLLGCVVQPQLVGDCWYVLTHFPASQAALARVTVQDEIAVAERFELYCNGVELANGYHELTDPNEQRRRLEEANRQRFERGKCCLPYDPTLIEALERGLPDCCGVAVGFDRLMMLRHSVSDLRFVLPEDAR